MIDQTSQIGYGSDTKKESSREESRMSHVSQRPVASGSGTFLVFVSNLHRETSEEAVREIFEEYGQIKSIDFAIDKLSGYCKGYCLVEYLNLEDANTAVKNAHLKKILGNALLVDHTFIAGEK